MAATDLYVRTPGTARPARPAGAGCLGQPSEAPLEFEYPSIVGAYTAAEWLLELTDVRPPQEPGRAERGGRSAAGGPVRQPGNQGGRE